MADLENLAEISGDQWAVTIGADNAPILAGLSLDITPTLSPVFNQRLGTTAVAEVIDGYAISGSLTLNQWSDAIAAKFLPVAAAAPRDLAAGGSVIPTTTLLFHDPHAANANGDLHFYQVSFGAMSTQNDGAGNKQWVVPFRGQQTTSGKTMRLGPAA